MRAMSSKFRGVALAIAAGAAVAGCAKTHVPEQPKAQKAPAKTETIYAVHEAPMPFGVQGEQVVLLDVPARQKNGAYIKPGSRPYMVVIQKNRPIKLLERPWSIYFDFDSAAIHSSQEGAIQDAVAYLNNNPDARVIILGYTDAEGSNAYNLKLARKRAMAVKMKLIAAGLKNGKQIVGIEAHPRSEYLINNSPSNHALAARNRRVEIMLVGHGATVSADATGGKTALVRCCSNM